MTITENIAQELAALSTMTEAEACEIYNVDCKEEAKQYIIDYWTCIA